MAQKQLSVAPLIRRISYTTGLPWHIDPDCPWCGNNTSFDACLRLNRAAEAVGVSRRTLQTWLRRGCVPLLAADRAAVELGWHPVFVWGEEWIDDEQD